MVHLLRAAEAGHPMAQAELAGQLWEGKHCAQDRETARKWAERSAAQNDAAGLFVLAMFQSETQKRRTYLERAAEMGLVHAQSRLGRELMFDLLKSVKEGIAVRNVDGSKLELDVFAAGDAARWLARAEAQGDEAAALTRGAALVLSDRFVPAPEEVLIEACTYLILGLRAHSGPFASATPGEKESARKELNKILQRLGRPAIDECTRRANAFVPKPELPYRHYTDP
jgi:hypothetical protein